MNKRKKSLFTQEECREIDREGLEGYVKVVNSKAFRDREKKRDMEKQANRRAKGKR